MTLSILLWILLGIALISLVSYRQTQFSPVNLGKAARLPILLLVAALAMGVSHLDALPSLRIGPADLGLLGVELVLAVVAGWGMGKLTEVATVDGAVSSRLRPLGLLIWFGFILVRVAGSAFAHLDHLVLAASVPLVLAMLAVVKGTQALVVSGSVSRHERESADVVRGTAARA